MQQTLRQVINFSAGPATLPETVLQQAASEMLDWHGTGVSVMEMSHRGPHYMRIHEEARQNLRDLLAVPPGHHILFLQGGATLQFAQVPLNLIGRGDGADFVNTGDWSAKAIKEAARFGAAREIASSQPEGFTRIPAQSSWKRSERAAYLHICSNETIRGVEYQFDPDDHGVPLVADMSSNILSRPVDVSRYGLIYAGAQKNIGPAGLVIVIIRDDLLGHALSATPTLLDYREQAQHDSMLNTPPTFSIYIAGLVFKWLKAQGGLAAMGEHNARKAQRLYDCIDASGFYRNAVAKDDRSRMNATFTLSDPALDERFLKEAAAEGMTDLKGHRTSGGMRASLYNAMPMEGVDRLVSFMRQFETRYG